MSPIASPVVDEGTISPIASLVVGGGRKVRNGRKKNRMKNGEGFLSYHLFLSECLSVLVLPSILIVFVCFVVCLRNQGMESGEVPLSVKLTVG